MFPPFLSSALLLYIQCLETSGRLVFICICWEFWKSWDASQGCGGRDVPCVSQSSGATRSRRRAGAVLTGAGGAWALSLPCAIILEGGGTGPGGVACLTLMLACSSRTVEPHS